MSTKTAYTLEDSFRSDLRRMRICSSFRTSAIMPFITYFYDKLIKQGKDPSFARVYAIYLASTMDYWVIDQLEEGIAIDIEENHEDWTDEEQDAEILKQKTDLMEKEFQLQMNKENNLKFCF